MNQASGPIRVLQVNSYFDGGGIDSQTLELSTGLRDLGDDVTLSVPRASHWEPLARRRGLRVETFTKQGGFSLHRLLAWVRTIRRRRIQVIHAHQGADYWPAVLAAWLAGGRTRAVVTRHLVTRPRMLTRSLLLSAAHVIAVSQAVEQVLAREMRGSRRRLHGIHAGIDVERFANANGRQAAGFRERLGWTREAVVLGMIGGSGLSGEKGQDEFLRAAARLQESFPLARFALIGVGAGESRLRQCADALGLGARVSMIPFTDEIEIPINALDILVHPPRGSEALGLVLLEAMAAGKPIIASRLDGIPEAVRDGEQGLLVPPGDGDALVAAMRTLLERPELRERFGRSGRERVRRHYSRRQMALGTHELYATLVARRGPGAFAAPRRSLGSGS